MSDWLDRIPLPILVLACLTVGLAPFAPPHLWDKLTLLTRLELVGPIDWLDLLFHGAPWALLLLKLLRLRSRAGDGGA